MIEFSKYLILYVISMNNYISFKVIHFQNLKEKLVHQKNLYPI